MQFLLGGKNTILDFSYLLEACFKLVYNPPTWAFLANLSICDFLKTPKYI